MPRQEIIEKTNAFLIGTLDIDRALITPDTELKRDIGITSVDAVAIASFAQKTFGCAIVMRDIKAIVTIDELYNYIAQNSPIATNICVTSARPRANNKYFPLKPQINLNFIIKSLYIPNICSTFAP